MPGFSQPSVLFAGNSSAPDRAFYRMVFDRLDKTKYTRYVELGVGSFAASLVALSGGFAADSMETSDVTLYTAIVGTTVSGGNLADLGMTLDGQLVDVPDTDQVTQGAHLLYVHWLARMQAHPEVDYWTNLVRDLVDREDEHKAHLRVSLEGLAQRLKGVRFEPKCMWDHLEEVWDDPHAIVVAAPPTYKCLERSERILTADLRWVPCGELEVGDKILAFDENHGGEHGAHRRWQFGEITHSEPAEKECVRVTLANGDSVVCTTDHPWLVSSGPGSVRKWVQAADLLAKPRRGATPAARYVFQAVDTWEPQRSYDAGWLAGMFDGEGSLSIGVANKLVFTQAPGPLSELFESRMAACGFKPAGHVWRQKGPLSQKEVINFHMTGGFREICRVLGELRPERLLRKLQDADLGGRAIRADHVAIVSVEPVGLRQVQSISTSTRTYVGEGYLMHNSGFEKFFNTGERVDWAEPPYSVFDPEVDMQRLRDVMVDRAALLMYLQEDETGKAADPRPVFAHPLGPGRTGYVISNRPDEIFALTGGPRVSTRKTPDYVRTGAPIISPDHEITADSVVQLIPVKSGECDYYRTLWMHRLAAAPGSSNLLVVIDGYAAGVVGYSAEPMARPFPNSTKWTSSILMRFAFGAPHTSLRLTRLATMLALRKQTAELVFQGQSCIYLAASHGLLTVEMTRHPEAKGLRGLMELVDRKDHPDGYKLYYWATWSDTTVADTLTAFLKKEVQWQKARAKAQGNGSA